MFAVNKFDASSQHAAQGPPLKTFIFQPPPGETASLEEALVQAYAQHTKKAVDAVREHFPGLSLDGRLAIVVPDKKFSEEHRDAFLKILNQEHSTAGSEQLEVQLESALESSATIPGLSTRARDDKIERITFAPIEEMDGLERLFVIGVGFDLPQTGRSKLYRAITRAQMMFLIVNEGIPGGWLEFMGHIKVSHTGLGAHSPCTVNCLFL